MGLPALSREDRLRAREGRQAIMEAPQVSDGSGTPRTYAAETTTATAARVRIIVTALVRATDQGWLVYGYRVGSSAGRRAGSVPQNPRLYLVGKRV